MRKKLQQLTERQLEIMDVIWSLGSATVTDVHRALRRTRLARKTLATILTRLEEQKVVAHRADGREFVYRALVTRDQVARAKLRSMLNYVLGGSTPSLIRYALEEDETQPGDIEKVEALLRGQNGAGHREARVRAPLRLRGRKHPNWELRV